MYEVVVNAKCTTENYTDDGNALNLNNKPLYGIVSNLAGWNDTPQLDGVNFSAAGSDNISLVVAPTRNVTFELVGEKLVTTNPEAIGELTIDDWYKATIDSYAQVRYEGMTKAACRALFSSLNSVSGGWYHQAHPWEYTCENNTLKWKENTNVTTYQCLNDYKATQDDSGLFTAELTLHCQETIMTKSPSQLGPFSWPSVWSSVPGLSNYL